MRDMPYLNPARPGLGVGAWQAPRTACPCAEGDPGPMEAQLAARAQQEEYQRNLADLQEWQASQRLKDEQRRRQATGSASGPAQGLAPIRCSSAGPRGSGQGRLQPELLACQAALVRAGGSGIARVGAPLSSRVWRLQGLRGSQRVPEWGHCD